MTTLKATPAQSIALERRRLTDRAALVRGRVEATPGCNLLPKIANVENRMRLMQFAMAKTLLDEIDDTLEDLSRKAEVQAMQHARAEQDRLLAANGVETARTASGAGVRHGLLWLIHKGKVGGARRDAGIRYSNDYALARAESLRSCLNDNVAGQALDYDTAQEKQTAARQRLRIIKTHISASTGTTSLVDILDAVCGRGDTIRSLAANDERTCAALEAKLLIALDMSAAALRHNHST